MMFVKRLARKINVNGYTLLELVLAMGISAVLLGAVFLACDICLQSFIESQEEGTAVKFLDMIAWTITNGDRQSYGLRDALELIECTPVSVTYVPLWEDKFFTKPYNDPPPGQGSYQGMIFDMDMTNNHKPFRYGSGVPLLEATEFVGGMWQYTSRTPELLTIDPATGAEKIRIELSGAYKVTPLQDMRIVYWPDSERAPETAVKLEYNNPGIWKTHNNVYREVRPTEFSQLSDVIQVTGCSFEYYDNMNERILFDPPLPDLTGKIPEEKIHSITAILVNLETQIGKAPGVRKREIPVFTNLMNSRTKGSLKILDPPSAPGAGDGTKILLRRTDPAVTDPDEQDVLRLVNIIGIPAGGGQIILEADPVAAGEQNWRVTLDIETVSGDEKITGCTVEQPAGTTIGQTVNLTHRVIYSFDLMDLTGVGLVDCGYGDMDFSGGAVLEVIQNDAAGAAISVKP